MNNFIFCQNWTEDAKLEGWTPPGRTKTKAASRKAEHMDEVEREVFQEFQKVIASNINYHPSERVNKDSSLNENSKNKVYDIINSYHLYCLICGNHYYTQSVSNDINSFFQKHQNSSYHKACRLAENYPENKPIYVWEKWLYTARCNICNISDIEANVIDAVLTPNSYIKIHQCFYEKEYKESSRNTVKKIELLKKFCGLKSFVKKFLCDIGNDRVVCLLCGFQKNGTIESYQYHLFSDEHLKNFYKIMWNNFNFGIKDLLNGFNLQLVANWLLTQNLNVSQKSYKICEDRENCIKESNNGLDVYVGVERNSSFSPKQVEDLLKFDSEDLIFNNRCLICQVDVDPNHMTANLHTEKVSCMDIEKFQKSEEYKIYVSNRENRLMPHFIRIKMYRKLENHLAVYGLKIGMTLEPDLNVVITSKSIEINSREKDRAKTICDEPQKLNSVKEITVKNQYLFTKMFTQIDSDNVHCKICNRKINKSSLLAHTLGKSHKNEIKKWNDLKALFSNSKYFEPFIQINQDVVCLICGMVFDGKLMFNHLETPTHSLNFKSYVSTKSTIPISSSFKFKNDNCVCVHCGASVKGLSGDRNVFSLSSTVKNIKNHWPCLKENAAVDVDKGAATKSEFPVNSNESVSNNNQNVKITLPCEKERLDMKSDGKFCAKNIPFDFVSFQRTVKSIMDAFEDKIIENVASNSNALVDQIQKTNKKALIIKPEKQKVPEPTSITIGPQIKEKQIQIEKRESSLEDKNNEKKKKNQMVEKRTQTKKEAQNFKEEHEVLLITDFPKERTKKSILEKLSCYGKIKYYYLMGETVVVAFNTKGTAEVVVNGPPITIKKKPLKIVYSRRLPSENPGNNLNPLNKKLESLLENHDNLVAYIMDLVSKSVDSMQSYVEKLRERFVCDTIMSAVKPFYPNSRCYPFGSRLSGLTLNDSDFDVFLDCGNTYEGTSKSGRSFELDLIRTVGSALRKTKECSQLIVVDRARVPIISFLHKRTLLHCDLSFKNGLSVQNTILLRFMVSLDSRVKPLILFLKFWANLCKLHGPPHFSSYGIAMLVIFYLQQLSSPVLPSVETLQNNFKGRRLTIEGWDCNFSTDITILPKFDNKETLPELLTGFFDFYANFDYSQYIICPLTGKPLSRKAFSNPEEVQLPMPIMRQILNLPCPLSHLVNDKIHICIMDPFDLSHILTKNFTSRALVSFIHYCKLSAAKLKG